MSYIDDLGDELAQRCIAAIAETGNEDLVNDISKLLGATSQSLQESFMTAFRVRRANARANALLDGKLAAFRGEG
ncbi:hypothetical protein [Albirhodobacter sp. R86504]|jgi:hypothetical protein|uniref:hypothetical protein n=1 Tax=Albirhodobacter sp. R86504 TaxID=3093848 RepID=UPI00366E15C4